jgi:hypothetical protein
MAESFLPLETSRREDEIARAIYAFQCQQRTEPFGVAGFFCSQSAENKTKFIDKPARSAIPSQKAKIGGRTVNRLSVDGKKRWSIIETARRWAKHRFL